LPLQQNIQNAGRHFFLKAEVEKLGFCIVRVFGSPFWLFRRFGTCKQAFVRSRRSLLTFSTVSTSAVTTAANSNSNLFAMLTVELWKYPITTGSKGVKKIGKTSTKNTKTSPRTADGNQSQGSTGAN
jgi:hypothetical protein